MTSPVSRMSGMEVFVAIGVHGPDTAIVGAYGEFWLAQAAARAWCADNWPGESEPMVQKFVVDADPQVHTERRR